MFDYVQATGIANREAVIQLLECCDESLRKDLTCSAGCSLLNKTPNKILASIKVLAVWEENIMVARVNLHNMRQDHEEPIRAFGARIRSQAGICNYSKKSLVCNSDVIYTEHILRDVFTRGLDDHEIQLELLGNPNQDMTLEEVFKFVEMKEAGKHSAFTLSEGVHTDSSS